MKRDIGGEINFVICDAKEVREKRRRQNGSKEWVREVNYIISMREGRV